MKIPYDNENRGSTDFWGTATFFVREVYINYIRSEVGKCYNLICEYIKES